VRKGGGRGEKGRGREREGQAKRFATLSLSPV
jgi:hypothetical protein